MITVVPGDLRDRLDVAPTFADRNLGERGGRAGVSGTGVFRIVLKIGFRRRIGSASAVIKVAPGEGSFMDLISHPEEERREVIPD
jgi:hypothetical protein